MSSINPNSKSLLKSKTKRKNQNKAEDSNKKQKSAKKSFYSDNDSDSLKEEQEQDEDISKWAKQDNSLSQLTQSFLDYIKKKGRIRISINELVEDLKVKKRRIYDITNVLQGIGYLQKIGKNEILWIKDSNTISIPNGTNSSKDEMASENYISNYSQLKKELEDLKSQKNNIDEELNKYREEFKLISEKNEFPKYGYITFNDITDLSLSEKVNFLLIKAPKGTLINVIDDEESKKAFNKIKIQMENGKIKKDEKLLNTLGNIHHIFFTSHDQELKIYKIDDGKIKQQLNEENDSNSNNSLYQNFQNNIINNGNNINFEKNILANQNNGSNKIYNQHFQNNSSGQNNPTIFNFDPINIGNLANMQNNKQAFSFDENNIKQNLNNKNDESTNNNNNYRNIGLSSMFKK